MAHHKRKGPKATRSGCLYCKPHKAWGNSQQALHPKYQRVRERVSEHS